MPTKASIVTKISTEIAPADLAVLVIHGFTATPFTVEYQAAELRKRGHHVVTPLLPGHGTTATDLAQVSWRDWVECIDREFAALTLRFAHVAVIGQSLGGLLALHLAATNPKVAAVVSLAAPLWLSGVAAQAARLTGPNGLLRALPWLPKTGGSDVRDPDIKANDPAYRRISTKALAQLMEFMKIVDGELESIAAPLLVMHSEKDHTAPVTCALRIASAGRARRVRLLQHSFHLIAVDIERDQVASEIAEFFAQYVG
jgi:carboxylesterase